MALDCVTSNVDSDLPDEIVDTSTLTLSIDSMGVATLSISIFNKQELAPNSSVEVFDLGPTRKFRGFLESDSPQQLRGTEYIEHRIVAKGAVCRN